MRSIHTARLFVQALSTGATTSLFELQKELIAGNLGRGRWVALVLGAALVAFLVGYGFNRLVSISRLLRRALMRGDDMEGDWTNLAVDKKTGELINVAFTTTTYRDGYFCYDGTAWNQTTEQTNHWRTLQSDYSGDRLTFRYETWMAGTTTRAVQGSGILRFTREHDRITGYTGEFIDLWHARECVNIGERMRYGFLERRKLTEEQRKARAESRLDERLKHFRRELGIAAEPT